MSGTEPHSTKSSAWRFLLAGGANTAITAALLTLLSLVIDPSVAYALVFTVGVVMSVVLADRFVFGVRMSRWAIVAYTAMYLVVFLIGLATVRWMTSQGLPDAGSGIVVVVTAPLTFLGGRLITSLVHRSRQSTAPSTGQVS